MAKAVNEILANPALAMSMRAKAYKYGRSITWPRIGRAYWQLFREVLDESHAVEKTYFIQPAVSNSTVQFQIA